MDIKRCGEDQSQCPLDVALHVGDRTIKRLAPVHTTPENSLAANQLLRQALHEVVEVLGCQGPERDSNRQVICPLSETARTARGFGSGTVSSGSFALSNVAAAPSLLKADKSVPLPQNGIQSSGYL